MSRKKFPNGRAIVKARAIETLVDPEDRSTGIVNLICGHCGQLSSQRVSLHYQDPKKCGESLKDQRDIWASILAYDNICPNCDVLNVSQNVEKYLRDERRVRKLMADLGDPP